MGPHKVKRKYLRYSNSQVSQPLKEEDGNNFTHLISELDIEDKPDIEIADLANYIPNLNRVKTLFSFFFESLLRQDQILICYLYLDNEFLLFL